MNNTSRWTAPALVVACAAMTMGCAENPHRRHEDMRNAGVGAVGGAIVGAVVGGDALAGAAVGAVAGALLGRLVIDGHERPVYADGRNGRYWQDEDGHRHPMR